MSDSSVTSTEFQKSPGRFIEMAAKEPVFITKHNRPARVMLDIREYQKLLDREKVESYYAHELPDDWKELLQKNVDLSHLDDSLDDHISKDLKNQGIELS